MDIDKYIAQLPMRAVKPRADGSFTVMPLMSQGRISTEHFVAVSDAVREYGLSIRVTAGQKIVIDGVSEEHLKDVVERISPVGDVHKYRVAACLGNTGCKFGQQDSMAMAVKLESFLDGYQLPTKLKSSVSGCSMCCAESMIRDIGLIGRNSGWTVSFGGNGGRRVRQADVLAQDISDAEAFELIGKVLDFYSKNAKGKERTARFVERVGIDAIKDAVSCE